MLIITNISAPNITATYYFNASNKELPNAELPNAASYTYDDDAGPALNHSAAMRRIAETFVGRAMAYDDQWIGIMTTATTCVWTRKPYTLS